MGNALAEELVAVAREETNQRREAGEPLLMVVVDLDDEIAVAHPRSVIPDLDRASVAPTSPKALPGVSVIDAPRVERTRTPLSPHASTWRPRRSQAR